MIVTNLLAAALDPLMLFVAAIPMGLVLFWGLFFWLSLRARARAYIETEAILKGQGFETARSSVLDPDPMIQRLNISRLGYNSYHSHEYTLPGSGGETMYVMEYEFTVKGIPSYTM